MDIIAVLIAIFVVFISIVLFAFFVKKKVKRDGLLLMGLSDSGKTLIFARLVHQKFVDTFTSIKENVKSYDTGKNTLQLIDIPGQERVRGRVFDSFKTSARAIVFIVDSSKVQHDIRDVAEYLHNILSDSVVFNNRPDVMVLCNKQDETLGKSSNSVRSMLEKELNIVRSTKASQRRLAVDDRSPEITLGDPDKQFKFDDLPFKLSFAESSAIMSNEETGPSLDELVEWIKALK